MERFFDYLFLGNWTNIAVSCPQELLNKYNNGSEIRKLSFDYFGSYLIVPRIPIDDERGFFDFINALLQQYENSKMYFYYVGILLLSVILSLNRKRFIKSLTLRLFTNYYFGFLLLQFFFVVLSFLNTNLIWTPLKDKYVWCVKKYPTYEIYYPTRYEEYHLAYDIYFRNISAVYKTAVKHILPIFLILHRVTTYFACAEPFIFQRYFSDKHLKIYYPLLGLLIYVLHFIGYSIAIKTGDNIYLDVYNRYVNLVAAFLSIIHFVMAAFSVLVVIQFRQSAKAELKEFKSFLGFSTGPVILSFIEQMLLLPRHFLWANNSRFMILDSAWMMSLLSNFLYDIQPIYLCILYFCFVPFYRKLLCWFCLKNSSKTKIEIISITNGPKFQPKTNP